MGKNPGFRAWFYFRQGWSTYFAFIFAAVNTLTVTYYLAIDNYPFLKSVFPSFEQYILIVVIIGIPLLVGVGYAHYKKTPSFRAEADVFVEEDVLEEAGYIAPPEQEEPVTDVQVEEFREFLDNVNPDDFAG